MKKLSVLLAVLVTTLTGCVAYEVPVTSQQGYYYDRDRAPASAYRDHDRDGVPDRWDNRPNNPRRW